MTPLERFQSLTPTHEAVLEAVDQLEAEWGVGAPAEKVAWRAGVSLTVAESSLEDLALVGLVTWCATAGEAFGERAVPVLGEVA